ncbi:MAG: N-acetyltransferase family protein [Clostridia bacterium]|nr:N-acetyltransferase family protein [Clostridia bacterium]
MSAVLRLAAESDAEAFSRIYAPYTATSITFECHAPDADEFRARIRNISDFYPFLACEADGAVIGYSYAHRLREREAYDWTAELSIYIDGNFTGKGVGKPLYMAVLDLLTLQGFKNAYGSMVIPNDKSEHVHLACGFTEAGIWHRSGYKLGKWHDLKWFERPLGEQTDSPPPIIPFPMLDSEKTASVLKARTLEIERKL